MATTEAKGRLGILVGGGPAPGINGVISAAGIEALDNGFEVVGLYDGFESICSGEISIGNQDQPARTLGYGDLTHIHWEGGTILRISRYRPSDEDLPRALENLEKIGVRYLLTIGGDDTLSSSQRLAALAAGRINVAHIPKTIDNDLPLPANTPTFGFETARSRGAEIVNSLLYDAKATNRWFLVIMMGRTAGHLGLAVAKSIGATRAIIPEEFVDEEKITLNDIADTFIASMIARRAKPRPRLDGVAIVAEGIVYKLKPEDLKEMERKNLAKLEYDQYDNIKLQNILLGRALQERIVERLDKGFGLNGGEPLTKGIVTKDVGYELRCCHPIPFDVEYTRDLGYAGAKFLLEGKTECLISLKNGHTNPIPYDEILDPETGKFRTRLVDVHSDSYEVARKYMFRLDQEHFDDLNTLQNMASVVNMSPEQFKENFQRVIDIQTNREHDRPS